MSVFDRNWCDLNEINVWKPVDRFIWRPVTHSQAHAWSLRCSICHHIEWKWKWRGEQFLRVTEFHSADRLHPMRAPSVNIPYRIQPTPPQIKANCTVFWIIDRGSTDYTREREYWNERECSNILIYTLSPPPHYSCLRIFAFSFVYLS